MKIAVIIDSLQMMHLSTTTVLLVSVLIAATSCAHRHSHEAHVVPHHALREFSNNGITVVGIATKGHGADEYEVWKTQIAVHGKTPLHSHDSEEVFVILKGQGEAIIGGEVHLFEAPCTLIAPAGIAHQLVNTGATETDAVVVIGIDSTIYDSDQKIMSLPWRE
ncbi:MAG: hypothetical protein ABS34_05265 [Opitutaceae bacterium BACL24 MAG-120322-bin51]|jgi:mannose-6-phosphate isomerase-like protein (cupin superfamily)|nr:MAG: hypothetical protein ABS34_05265 [Opitutaceae bacterium BACL24 MAG-120322-bin51]